MWSGNLTHKTSPGCIGVAVQMSAIVVTESRLNRGINPRIPQLVLGCGFSARGVALQFVCKIPPGVTPRTPFYALAAKGTTSARSELSFSRSPGLILSPCHRRETSTSTAWISDSPARSSGIVLMTLVRRQASSISRSKEFVVRTRRRCDSGSFDEDLPEPAD